MKKSVTGLAVLFSLLITVIVVRTFLYTDSETSQDGIPAVDVSLDETSVVSRLSQAIQFPTISHGGKAFDAEAFAAFNHFLHKSFPRVYSQLKVQQINDYSLLMEWQGKDDKLQPILLMSHMDVVPVIPGTEGSWTWPPFEGKVADGYIWGRGTVDDKSGVLGILEATEKLLAEGYQPERSVFLAFGHDEEIGGQKGAVTIASLLQKRGLFFEYVLDEGGVVTKGVVPGIEGLVAVIGPGEKGYLSLKLTAQGGGGHSSQPPSETAIGRLAKALSRLEEKPFPMNLEYTADFIQQLGPEVPFVQRMLFANRWLFEPFADGLVPNVPALMAGMRTTTAPTMLSGSVKDNVLPLNPSAVVNFRILPGETMETVTARVKEVIDDDSITLEHYGFGGNPSRVSPTDSFGYQQLERSIHEVIADPSLRIAPRIVIAATDARHFDALTDNSYRFMGVTLGPKELKGIHGTDERVSVESYLQAVKIYYQLIRNSTGQS